MFESIGAEIAYPDRILKLRADGHLQQSGKDQSRDILIEAMRVDAEPRNGGDCQLACRRA